MEENHWKEKCLEKWRDELGKLDLNFFEFWIHGFDDDKKKIFSYKVEKPENALDEFIKLHEEWIKKNSNNIRHFELEKVDLRTETHTLFYIS